METKLVLVGGKANRKEIRLKLPATVGRGKDADLTVAHPLVSRHHCRLEEVDGALVLRDNNSTNGTFVGKKRITQVVLKPGDQFTVGPLTFKAVYEHDGAFPNLGQPTAKKGASEALGLPATAEREDQDPDFTVALDSADAVKAKPPTKPAEPKAPTKAKAPLAEAKPAAKPTAKPADKKPAPSAKTKPEPVQPSAAEAASADDAGAMDWLAEPTASAPIQEPEPLADFGFDEEPMAAEAPAPPLPVEELPAEELDSLPPAAEEEAEVLDWLEQPAAADAPAEPLAEVSFDEEPGAAEALAPPLPVEELPAEELDSLPPAAVEEEAEVLDWLEQPAAAEAPAEPVAEVNFDDEPMAAEAPAQSAPAEELDSLPPAAVEEEAEVLDWLEQPAAAEAPAEPVAEVNFDDEPMAAEAPAQSAPAEELDSLPPAAVEEEAEVLDWLEQPAAAEAPAEPVAEVNFDEEPMAAEAPAQGLPVEEFDSLPPAAVEEEAEVLDWLEEPAVADAPAEPVAEVSFDDEPMAAEAPAQSAPAEELDSLPPAAVEEEAEVLDWLEQPAAADAPAEPVAEVSFDEEPMAAEAPAQALPVEELDSLSPAAVEEEAEVLDWLEQPAAADAPAELVADFGIDEEPMAAEAPAQALPVEELDSLPPAAAEEEAEVLDWLEQPAAAAAPAELVADFGIDEEPIEAEAPAQPAPAEELDSLPPTAGEEEAEVLDWLEEPAAADAPAEPIADFRVDKEPIAAAEDDEVTLPAAEAEDDVFGWLEEPPAGALHEEAEAPGDIFGEEPVPAEPLADLSSAEEAIAAQPLPEEVEEVTLPAAEADADFMDWLDEPAVGAPQAEAEPLGDIGFGELPIAAEPIIEDAAPIEPAALVPPAADADDDFMDWLQEPEPRTAHSEVESLETMSFDEQPVPAEALPDAALVEEPSADAFRAEEADLIASPAADAEAGVLDWLEEPAVGAPQAEAEPPGDVGFGELPVAAEPIIEDAAPIEPVALVPPAAEAEDDFMDWLQEPAASAPQAEAEPLGDIEFGEVPVAAEPILEDAAPIEPAALVPPAADADDDFMDWLQEPEPRTAHSEVESLETMSFDEQPVPAEALPDAALIEEPPADAFPVEEADLIASPAAEAEAGVLDWLEEPAVADGLAEAEPLTDFSLDEEPVAAEPYDAAAGLPESEPTAPPPADADEMTAFWPGETTVVDPQLEDQASDEMDFDFGNEADADAALGGLPPPADETMLMDQDAVDATPALPDESLDLELNFDAEQGAADLDATEMFVATGDAEQQPALAEPVGSSDDDAFGSLVDAGEVFELAEPTAAEEGVEFDLADDAPIPAASEIQSSDVAELPPSSSKARRGESATEKPAKKGWWPFGKSKKEKPEKKAKPEPKGRKSAAAKEPEPEEMPLAAAESMPLAPPEEFAEPVPPSAAADADGLPDFSFADSGNEAPAKSGGDDDLEDFFQDLGLK